MKFRCKDCFCFRLVPTEYGLYAPNEQKGWCEGKMPCPSSLVKYEARWPIVNGDLHGCYEGQKISEEEKKKFEKSIKKNKDAKDE